MIRVHSIVDSSTVNGPGDRTVIWLQGCSLACPGCWNPDTHAERGGNLMAPEDLARGFKYWGVSGVTFSGGEPMEQAPGLIMAMSAIARDHSYSLSIGMFTGYTLRELETGNYRTRVEDSAIDDTRYKSLLWREIRYYLDFAVMGRYNRNMPAPADRPLITSGNQKLELFTARYKPEDFAPLAVEVNIGPGGLTQITGFPV